MVIRLKIIREEIKVIKPIKKPKIKEISIKDNSKNKIDEKLDKIYDSQAKRRKKRK